MKNLTLSVYRSHYFPFTYKPGFFSSVSQHMSKCHFCVWSLKGEDSESERGGSRAPLFNLMVFSVVVAKILVTLVKLLEQHMD